VAGEEKKGWKKKKKKKRKGEVASDLGRDETCLFFFSPSRLIVADWKEIGGGGKGKKNSRKREGEKSGGGCSRCGRSRHLWSPSSGRKKGKRRRKKKKIPVGEKERGGGKQPSPDQRLHQIFYGEKLPEGRKRGAARGDGTESIQQNIHHLNPNFLSEEGREGKSQKGEKRGEAYTTGAGKIASLYFQLSSVFVRSEGGKINQGGRKKEGEGGGGAADEWTRLFPVTLPSGARKKKTLPA